MDTTAGAAASPKFVSFSTPGTIAGSAKNPEPQAVRVSDLVSSVAPASSMSASAAPKIMSSGIPGSIGAKITPSVSVKDPFLKSSPLGISPSAPSGAKKKIMGVLDIIAVILIVALGALSGYLFVKNSGLNNELQAAQSGQQNVGTSLNSAAQTQIQALTVSNTALTAQVASLGISVQNLATNLSFLIAPTSSSATSTSVSVGGVLTAGLGKNTYSITTAYGVKVSVKNSSAAAVAAALQPLLGSTVQVLGTYIPGTPSIIVISVNGAPVSPPPAAAISTTSTAPNTSATTSMDIPPVGATGPAVQ